MKKSLLPLFLAACFLFAPIFSIAEYDQYTDHLPLYHELIGMIRAARIIVEKDFAKPVYEEDWGGLIGVAYFPVHGMEFRAFYDEDVIYEYKVDIMCDTYAHKRMDDLLSAFIFLVDDESETVEDASAVLEYLLSTQEGEDYTSYVLRQSEIERAHVRITAQSFSSSTSRVLSVYADFIDGQ